MMFKGAIFFTQKCHNAFAPTSFYGADLYTQKCRLKVAPKGRASPSAQKCQLNPALPNQSQGAKYISQQCHSGRAPKLITWCRTRSAAMPTCWRTIGGYKQIAVMPSQPRPQPTTWGHLHAPAMPADTRPTEFGPYTACRNARRRPPK